MAVHDDVYALAAGFAGALSADEAAALDRLCAAAEQQLQDRLRTGITVDSCGACFVCAAAWTALAGLAEAQGADGITAFGASDLSVTRNPEGAEGLRKQAEAIMGPYLADGFAFLGVRA